MGTLAQSRELTLVPQGRLRSLPLSKMLVSLGLLQATGILTVEKKRLKRRIVLVRGNVSAIVSNARDDRLFEWAVSQSLLELDESLQSSALESLGDSPLVAIPMVKLGLIDAASLPPTMRRHLFELLEQTATWNDGRYEIAPGRAQLGEEPSVELPAFEAGIAIARNEISRNPSIVSIPEWIVAPRLAASVPDALFEIEELEMVRSCEEPQRRDALRASMTERDADAIDAGLRVLCRAGLLVTTRPGKSTTDGQQTVDEDELFEFLKAAEAGDYFRVLGVSESDDADVIRQAYYAAVRRFHPDRFRQGELAAHHSRVEDSFRVVHEAVEILTDPEKRLELMRERKSKTQDPEHAARTHLAQARKIAGLGRRSEAADLLERGLARVPGHVDMSLNLHLLQVASPVKRAEALEALRLLAYEHPTRVDVLAGYALALRFAGRADDAALAADRARQLSTEHPMVKALYADQSGKDAVKRDPFAAHLV